MKKVLVIGSNSYIGINILKFTENYEKSKIQITMVSGSSGEWKYKDLYQYESIILLSAIVHRKENKNLKSLYEKINHQLAVEIAIKAKECHVKQFIFMSTAAVYGDMNGCITTETKPHPTTLYGLSKLAAENDIIKLQDNNFNIVIIRSPMVYGKGCKGNYEKLRRLAAYIPIFPDYHNKRSRIHIDKLSKCIIDIINSNESGYVLPQDDEYADTSRIVVNFRNEIGKKTKLIKSFNWIIRFLVTRWKLMNKVFGDFYYYTDDKCTDYL